MTIQLGKQACAISSKVSLVLKNVFPCAGETSPIIMIVLEYGNPLLRRSSLNHTNLKRFKGSPRLPIHQSSQTHLETVVFVNPFMMILLVINNLLCMVLPLNPSTILPYWRNGVFQVYTFLKKS